MSFDLLKLDPRLMKNIRELGFDIPTPIQKKAIPVILEGHDVIGLAQTGTGKTAAFALPILQRLIHGPRHKLRVLIVGPTRELVEQIYEAMGGLAARTGIMGLTVYGGVGMRPQVEGLRRGAEVVVACPGRLLDHVRQGTIRLSAVECLVLDEADRMFDMGFLPDIRRIVEQLPAQRQTLLFSATMPNEIRKLAHEILRHPVTLQIAHSRPAETVSHALYPVSQPLKGPLLLKILDHTVKESVLVFTRTKQRAKRLAQQFEHAGHSTTCLQGNLSQRQRKAAMDGFRSGRFQILVATDIAARGIDVSTISHVINFDMPATADDYTHRIGRTGRAAKTGDAFTLVTPEDESLVRAIERILGARIERRKVEGFDYAAKPAHPVPHAARRPHAGHRPAKKPHPHNRKSHGPRSGGHPGAHDRKNREAGASAFGKSASR